jgi:hypothetical protein
MNALFKDHRVISSVKIFLWGIFKSLNRGVSRNSYQSSWASSTPSTTAELAVEEGRLCWPPASPPSLYTHTRLRTARSLSVASGLEPEPSWLRRHLYFCHFASETNSPLPCLQKAQHPTLPLMSLLALHSSFPCNPKFVIFFLKSHGVTAGFRAWLCQALALEL